MALTKITSDVITSNVITANAIAQYTITSTNMANTGVIAGTYGSSNTIPVVTVDSAGRVSAVSNVAMAVYAANSNNSVLITNTVISSNVVIASNTGGFSIGPLVVAANTNITVQANARYVIF